MTQTWHRPATTVHLYFHNLSNNINAISVHLPQESCNFSHSNLRSLPVPQVPWWPVGPLPNTPAFPVSSTHSILSVLLSLFFIIWVHLVSVLFSVLKLYLGPDLIPELIWKDKNVLIGLGKGRIGQGTTKILFSRWRGTCVQRPRNSARLIHFIHSTKILREIIPKDYDSYTG